MTPTREQLAAEAAHLACQSFDMEGGTICTERSEDPELWCVECLARALAACLAAPPQAQPEPQAMPPIEPDDWVELEQWPNCEWVVLSVDSDGRVSLIGLDLRYRIRDVIGISKANGTVWTREPRR